MMARKKQRGRSIGEEILQGFREIADWREGKVALRVSVLVPENRTPLHPGVLLREEFRQPLHLTREQLAKRLEMLPKHVAEVERGELKITREIAERLADTLKTSPEFWLNLQASYDKALRRKTRKPRAKP